MGLPMHNIHAPTVGPVTSGPTSARTTTKESDEDLSLDELSKLKQRLESELSALGSVLDSHGVHMNTGLTTFDGFPRADIDVAQIRTTRARIIHLRNDHKALLSRIEKAVHARFAALAAAPPTSETPSTNTSVLSVSNDQPVLPFAIVNTVTEGSPAAEAGLQQGDKITKFGDANWLNNEKLGRVAQVVARNEGRSIAVDVVRNDTTLMLTLIPRRDWGGRGSLGCHLIAL